MTKNHENASSNPSPLDTILFPESVADLQGPEFTGDGHLAKGAEIAEIDGKRYLVPIGYKTGREAKRAWGNLRDYRLLLDTVSLAVDPGPEWDWGELDRIIPTNRILDWSKQWGMPYEDSAIRNRYHLTACPLRTFQKHAAALFLIYQLHHACVSRDPDRILIYYERLLRHPDFDRPPDWEDMNSKRMASLSKNDIATKVERSDFLADMIIEHEISRGLVIHYSTKRGISFTAHSLFDLCYHQMALLKMRGETPDGIHRVRTCRGCLNLFWGHGNARYCHKCDRRVIHTRRKRAQRKGLNDERTHPADSKG